MITSRKLAGFDEDIVGFAIPNSSIDGICRIGVLLEPNLVLIDSTSGKVIATHDFDEKVADMEKSICPDAFVQNQDIYYLVVARSKDESKLIVLYNSDSDIQPIGEFNLDEPLEDLRCIPKDDTFEIYGIKPNCTLVQLSFNYQTQTFAEIEEWDLSKKGIQCREPPESTPAILGMLGEKLELPSYSIDFMKIDAIEDPLVAVIIEDHFYLLKPEKEHSTFTVLSIYQARNKISAFQPITDSSKFLLGTKDQLLLLELKDNSIQELTNLQWGKPVTSVIELSPNSNLYLMSYKERKRTQDLYTYYDDEMVVLNVDLEDIPPTLEILTESFDGYEIIDFYVDDSGESNILGVFEKSLDLIEPDLKPAIDEDFVKIHLRHQNSLLTSPMHESELDKLINALQATNCIPSIEKAFKLRASSFDSKKHVDYRDTLKDLALTFENLLVFIYQNHPNQAIQQISSQRQTLGSLLCHSSGIFSNESWFSQLTDVYGILSSWAPSNPISDFEEKWEQLVANKIRDQRILNKGFNTLDTDVQKYVLIGLLRNLTAHKTQPSKIYLYEDEFKRTFDLTIAALMRLYEYCIHTKQIS